MSQHTAQNVNGSGLQRLRVYQDSLELEQAVFELTRDIGSKNFYPAGNTLRRHAAAIAHYIAESNNRYSYRLKLESLHLARSRADQLRLALKSYDDTTPQITQSLQDKSALISRQLWGLILSYKKRQQEHLHATRADATDALVAARAM